MFSSLKIKNKKGSHVGVVISFLLFITFIILMYVILSSKISLGENKKTSLEQIKSFILEDISENLTTTSVAVSQANPNCVQLKDFFLEIPPVSDNIIVKNNSEISLQESRSANDIFIQTSGNKFFQVLYSKEFSAVPTGGFGSCQLLQEGTGYSIGISRTENLVFESKIIKALINYTQGYNDFKKNLGISNEDEFGFIFTYSNNTILRTPEKNLTIDIYAERIPIQYIKIDGAREVGFINIIVW